jgi:hypothetical protein
MSQIDWALMPKCSQMAVQLQRQPTGEIERLVRRTAQFLRELA